MSQPGPRTQPGGPSARLALLALGALGLVAALAAPGPLLLPAQAQPSGEPSPPLTVLLFHPNDGVDPLGFAADGAGEADPFALRYAGLVAEKGRFDFPFFLADGVVPIEAIPDPAKPFASALAAYVQAVEARSVEEAPATLVVDSLVAESQVAVQVRVVPRTDLSAEDLHLRLALVEDHVEYQPPPGLTNGVTDHRFTVRAYTDLGNVSGPVDLVHTFTVAEGWARDRLSVAAWLQQDAPSPRFNAREVVQATHAEVGDRVEQAGKGVLVEMLSATWCDPCLYGDRAVEELAVDYGIAEPSTAAVESRYLDLTGRDALAVAAAAVLGVGVVLLARRVR